MERLESAVEHLLHHNKLPNLGKYGSNAELTVQSTAARHGSIVNDTVLSPSSTVNCCSSVGPSAAADTFTAEGPSSAGLRGDQDDDESDLVVPLPMNNLYNLTDPKNSQLMRVDPAEVNGPDFISQGALPLADAEFLFDYYRDHINPLLWDGILCSHKTLNEARQSSSLLVAVVLTVAGLHIPNREQSLMAAYDAFVSLMRRSCLLHCHSLDAIRALCIGAFYLTSLSWALCSRAVRVATEMNLHKSSVRYDDRDRSSGIGAPFERVRLWYILYVCDHQFALAYGRPPMMHEDAAIRNCDKLLTAGHGASSRGDHALIAQVKLFRILASGYFKYGCDADLELEGQDFETLQSFNISVDQWRFEHQSQIGQYNAASGTSKANNTLYYHLARFQLNSVSLRGISARGLSQDSSRLRMGCDRQEAANNAIAAAMATARLIIDDEGLQRSLIGLPIFTHAMIAVCASFLLKIAVVFGEQDGRNAGVLHLPRDLGQFGLGFSTKMALMNVQKLAEVLDSVAEMASQRHVARQVVTGLRELLQRFSPGRAPETFEYRQTVSQDVQVPPTGGGPKRNRDTRDVTVQVDNDWTSYLSGGGGMAQHVTEGIQNDGAEYQLGTFDLTGDLDWRFDDGCLLGMDATHPDLSFL